MKTASVIAKQNGNVWEIRGYTRPYVDILKANDCAWDGKKLVWTYTGAGLPPVVKQIIDGTYGLDANNPLPEPNNGNFENQVSEAESPLNRAKRPYSRKSERVSDDNSPLLANWKRAAQLGRIVEWDSASGTFRGVCHKVEGTSAMRVVTAVGHVELVIPFELLRFVSYWPKHTEPDGTCPYMIENQRGLKPGQDWLGWMTCCECGLFLDLESNRKVGKPLMGVGNGKVICPDCHRVKHKLPAIRIDEPKVVSAAALKNAANLRTLADRMQKDIDHHMRPFGDRNVTRKRQQEYESRMTDGRNLQKVQANLRALADAIEQNRLPEILQGVRTKWSVEWLTFRDWMPLPEHRYNETERNNLLKAGINELNYAQAYAAMQALGDGTVGEETPAQKLETLRMEVARKNIPDYFPTPPDVIDVLMRHVTPNAGETVLEPSAGSGHIAQVVRKRYPDAVLSVIEYHVTLQEILKLQGFDLVGDDFFAHDKQYNFIVQNPPFTDMTDIDHVRHAYECLKPGGRLVSVMSKSWQFRRDKKAVEFREWLDMVGGHAEDLPNGAFKASERSTGVATCYVVIDRD